jgi:hypothetical protein
MEAHLCCEAPRRGEGTGPEELAVPVEKQRTGNAIMFIQELFMQRCYLGRVISFRILSNSLLINNLTIRHSATASVV